MVVAAPYRAIPREEKRRLGVLAVHLWRATLIGGAPPVTVALRERMRHPVPGDLVLETSTIQWLIRRDPDLDDDRWDGQLVPFLRKEGRPRYSQEEWDEARGDSDPTTPPLEDTLICLNPDGTEFAWTNAELIAVPTSLDFP